MKLNYLDLIGACLSLSSTYYFTKTAQFAWIIGMGAILVNTTLYWQKGIYGHVVLEFIYFASMLIGLWRWNKDKKSRENSVKIRNLPLNAYFAFFLICIPIIWIVAQILILFTPSTIPYWDASTTVLSLLAQGLLILKFLQCWILWFMVDAMIAGIQMTQGMPFHALSTSVYLALAVLGYHRWMRLMSQDQDSAVEYNFLGKKNQARL